MSNQFPGQPGQPGEVPPTQVVPGAGAPQQPGPPPGYAPQPPPPGGAPYGATPGGAPYGGTPGPGGGFPPPGQPPFGAPPTGGGGGGKRIVIILAIVGVILLLIIGTAVALLVTRDDDDDKDSDRPKVTRTVTEPTDVTTDIPTDVTTDIPTDVTTDIPTDVTTDVTTEGGEGPTEDPEITARAYLNSLAEGNCLAVEGLSTPEWWAASYGSQRACKRDAGNQDMSTVDYQDVQAPIENGDGTVTLIATVADTTDSSGTTYTATWILSPSDDTWLVSAFQLV